MGDRFFVRSSVLRRFQINEVKSSASRKVYIHRLKAIARDGDGSYLNSWSTDVAFGPALLRFLYDELTGTRTCCPVKSGDKGGSGRTRAMKGVLA